jgi:hypothetical protein
LADASLAVILAIMNSEIRDRIVADRKAVDAGDRA